ncbi:restriction endonuclease subunit S [Sphingomonas sp. LY160]|uniref:restriction endonuclease subunit S n=1 Tax=Sphingomonas sp. LY160 TaxID=3095342 RepID=UPI002ADEFA3C|nr:restriction endonuclease subunit S [Sphingomonas sp. LY160]MEA1072040.1 restriction endonuclease subunit S [Sphingomonas sp. LY160]
MKSGWTEKPFDDVVISRGSGKSALAKSDWINFGQFPVIGQGAEAIEGWTDRDDLVLRTDQPVVLYGGHTRRAKIVQIPFVPGPNVRILWPKAGLDAHFLFYFLKFFEVESKGYADHFPLVRKCSVPIPPLKDQQRIVAVLDEAFLGIATATANTQKNLTNARALFESTLAEIFDKKAVAWSQVSLSEAGKTLTGNTPKTGDKGNFGNFLPFIKPGNFLPNGSIKYDGDGLSEKGAQSSRIIPAGSALMVCIGATIGKSGYTERNVTSNQQINAVIPKNGVLGKFLYYQFLTPSFQRSVLDGSGQATLPIISKSKWSSLAVRLPSTEKEQADAVKVLDAISEKSQQLLDLGRRKLAALSELKQSLLQKAFAGELT